MKKSWQLDRRTVLKGAGVSMALPWMEGMTKGPATKNGPPRRMCSVLFPFGIAMPKDDAPDREWGWFPTGEGKDYELTNVLRPLQPLMKDVSILGGLSHPNCRSMNGHDTGDTFLTANNLQPVTYRNTISLDQYAAQHIGDQTRLSSLAISTDGGTGPRTRTTTISYSADGQPVPALSDPKLIFQRMFGQDNASQNDQQKLENSGSILDLVLEQSNSLRSKLGRADQQKLDEFQTSVRDVEVRVERSQSWLDVPLPEVDASEIALESDPSTPIQFLEAMYDLMFLAFQTDLTRLTTYQLGSYGPSRARTFPSAIDLKGDWHSLAHGANKKGGAENLGRFDQFMTQHLARFIQRMKDTPEGPQGASLLDSTVLLYGSSNSRTHQNVNYPLILAGGSKLGIKHDHYLKFGPETPMSNLFVTMLQAIGVETESFVDSTGTLKGLS